MEMTRRDVLTAPQKPFKALFSMLGLGQDERDARRLQSHQLATPANINDILKEARRQGADGQNRQIAFIVTSSGDFKSLEQGYSCFYDIAIAEEGEEFHEIDPDRIIRLAMTTPDYWEGRGLEERRNFSLVFDLDQQTELPSAYAVLRNVEDKLRTKSPELADFLALSNLPPVLTREKTAPADLHVTRRKVIGLEKS